MWAVVADDQRQTSEEVEEATKKSLVGISV
jgi:hypothetical protein